MVDVGSVSGSGYQPPNPGGDNQRNKVAKEPGSNSSDRSPADQAPTVDSLALLRDISEHIHRIQGDLHQASTDEQRQALESELMGYQVALENLLCLDAGSPFDPTEVVTHLNEQLTTGGMAGPSGAVGRLLQDPDA